MAAIRIFIISHDGSGEWNTATHREENTFQEDLSQKVAEGCFVCVHVGFDRPFGDELEALRARFPRSLFLTLNGYHIFINKCKVHEIQATYGDLQNPAFLVTSGWGLAINISESDLVLREIFGNALSTVGSLVSTPIPEWLQHISNEHPSIYEEMASAQICDEDSYLSYENVLPVPARIIAGRIRFSFLSVLTNPSSPIGLLAVSPPWLLSSAVATANLTVRLANIFSCAGIKYFSDVLKYDESGLLDLPNFGKKSLADLASIIRESISTNPERFFRKDMGAASSVMHSSAGVASALPYISSLYDAEDFISLVDSVVADSEPRRSEVIRARMGYKEPPKTLDALGKIYNVSRERIRQYEREFHSKMRSSQVWSINLIPRILKVLTGRKSGLPLAGISVFDPWFKDAEKHPSTVAYVLENFCDSEVHLIDVDGSLFFTQISQDDWDSSLERAKEFYKSTAIGSSRSSIYDSISVMLPDLGRELSDELFHAASKFAHYSNPSDGSEPRLIAYGRNVEALIKAILEDSDRPLHFSEVVDRLKSYGREVGAGRVNIALQKQCLLVGSGTYALEKHLPFDAEQLKIFAKECEAVIESSPDRQWHIDEIFEIVSDQFPEHFDALTTHILNIALSRLDSVKYLGRSVWVSKQEGAGAQARIDVRQAVEAILKDAGRPMSTDEIKEKLSSDRGLGRIFQVIPNEVLIRVRRGVWGLIYRDVLLSPEDQELINTFLLEYIKGTGRGIHVSEVEGALRSGFGDRFTSIDPYLVYSLFQRAPGVKASIGSGYLFPEEWESARRLTVSEAIESLLGELGGRGLIFSELKSEVERLVGRKPIPDASVYSALKSLGAAFSDEGRWALLNADVIA